MREILKIALGVFIGGGALLIAHAFVDEVRTKSREAEVMRQLTGQDRPVSSPPILPAPVVADPCAGSRGPACGAVTPAAKSVSCMIKGEAWRLSESACLARGGKVE